MEAGEEGRGVLTKMREGEVRAKQAAREVRRRQKLAKISEAPPLSGQGGQYPILYAEPPWQYEHSSASRQIENHYPTMPLE